MVDWSVLALGLVAGFGAAMLAWVGKRRRSSLREDLTPFGLWSYLVFNLVVAVALVFVAVA